MTAVAVWDHKPVAEELLAARLERGWTPTPTATRDGPRVLGYAACAVTGGAGAKGAKDAESAEDASNA